MSVKVTPICFPPGLILKKSTVIPDGHLGVFTTTEVPIGQIFGPFKGKVIPVEEISSEMDMSYMWEIVQNGVFTHAIDGQDEWNSNWLRFVNLAPSRNVQTLHAVQHCGEVFYVAVRPIPSHTELLVWYGNTYSQQLGIFNFEGETLQKNDDITFKCTKCCRSFKYPKFLALHIKYKCSGFVDGLESTSVISAQTSRPSVVVNGELNSLGEKDQQGNGSEEEGQNDLSEQEEEELEEEDKEEEEEEEGEGDEDEDDEDEEKEGSSKRMKGEHESYTNGKGKDAENSQPQPTTPKPFKCNDCGKHFMFSGDLSKHSRIHSGARPFSCQFCGKAYRQNAHLRRHIAQVHKGEDSYSCEQCGKMFTDIDVYSKHLLTHVCQRPYICPKCGKVFRNNYNFIRHTGMKPYKCPLCTRTFGHASVLSSHVRTHNGDRPFACTVCGKSYAQSSTLYAHKRTHEVQDKQFKCDTCDKMFLTKSLLHRHLGTHMRNSQLRYCEICGKTFRKAGSLSLHLKVHRTETPFSCHKCGRKFKQVNYLTRHLRRHEQELDDSTVTDEEIPQDPISDEGTDDIADLASQE